MRLPLLALLAATSLTAPALAAPTLVDTFVGADTHGYGDVIGEAKLFDISSATASFDGRSITVAINTNYSKPTEGTVFGDLFLNPTWTVAARCTDAVCDNAGSKYQRNDWGYAVHLTSGATPASGAALYQLPTTGADAVLTASSPQGFYYRDGQQVQIDPTKATALSTASASVTPASTGSVDTTTVSFTFVAPNSLLTPDGGFSFAFSWAPTCANDIIEGVVSGPGPTNGNPTNGTPLPEPAGLAALGLGLLALGTLRIRTRA